MHHSIYNLNEDASKHRQSVNEPWFDKQLKGDQWLWHSWSEQLFPTTEGSGS